MYGCKILDWMRSCYSYSGKWDFGDGLGLVDATIRYYRPCFDDGQKFRVPYGSHFYGGDGQSQGHAVKPPGWQWCDGTLPVPFPPCVCCGNGRPDDPCHGCLNLIYHMLVNWEEPVGGGADFLVELLWDATIGKYRVVGDQLWPTEAWALDFVRYDSETGSMIGEGHSDRKRWEFVMTNTCVQTPQWLDSKGYLLDHGIIEVSSVIVSE